MWLLNAMIIAIAMYSKIPMPRVDWNEKNMRYAMCFFPLVGVIIGVLEAVAGNLITVWKGEGTFFLCSCIDFDSGFYNRWDSPGWIRRYDGRKKFLWRPGEEAGDSERPTYGSICDHQSLLLFPSVCGDF